MNMKHVPAFVLLAVLLWAIPAYAGTTGVLRGCVTDEATGKPVAGAVVYAQSPAQSQKTQADATGRFVFIDLAPGTYTVIAMARHFEPASIAGITVRADQAEEVPIGMERMLVTWTDQSMGHYDPSRLVRPGIVSDVYVVYFGRLNGASIPVRTTAEMLRFIPGVNAAPGQPAIH